LGYLWLYSDTKASKTVLGSWPFPTFVQSTWERQDRKFERFPLLKSCVTDFNSVFWGKYSLLKKVKIGKWSERSLRIFPLRILWRNNLGKYCQWVLQSEQSRVGPEMSGIIIWENKVSKNSCVVVCCS
jgi:hypothetical protein